MKKSVSLALATLMLLCAAVSLGEAPAAFYNEASGITFTVPEGFVAQDATEAAAEDTTMLMLAEDNDSPVLYCYEVYYNEAFAGLWLEDLTEEQIGAMAEGIAEALGESNYTSTEVDGITYLLLHNTDNTCACVVSMLNGWTCALYALDVNGDELPDTVWDTLDTLQMGISYEATEE